MPRPRTQLEHDAMPFGEHLEELRRRLLYALLTVAPIFILAMVFGRHLIEFIIAPASAQLAAAKLPGSFIVTNPLEAMGAWFRVAAVVTIVVGIPSILLQLWMFVAPGLYPHERRFALLLIPLSLVLSIVGLLFLYYVMLPAMLSFLIRFGASIGQTAPTVLADLPAITYPSIPIIPGDPPAPAPGSVWINSRLEQLRINIAPQGQPATIVGSTLNRTSGVSQQYRISEYIELVFTMSLAFVVGFQTPVVVLLLGWMGLVNRAFLVKSRKYAIFIAFIVAAILTPSPDPFSMVILAVPLYLLYELGLLLLKVVPASNLVARRTREPADAGDA